MPYDSGHSEGKIFKSDIGFDLDQLNSQDLSSLSKDQLTSAIDKIQNAQNWASKYHGDWDLDPLAQAKSKYQNALTDVQTKEFSGEYDVERQSALTDLTSALSDQNNLTFNAIFKPQIAKALNAQGILLGGAQKEVEAGAKGQLDAASQQTLTDFSTQTTEGDVNIGLSGLEAKLQNEKETDLTQYNLDLTQAQNMLSKQLGTIAQPSTLQYALMAGQGVGSMYNLFNPGTGNGGTNLFGGAGGAQGGPLDMAPIPGLPVGASPAYAQSVGK